MGEFSVGFLVIRVRFDIHTKSFGLRYPLGPNLLFTYVYLPSSYLVGRAGIEPATLWSSGTTSPIALPIELPPLTYNLVSNSVS